MSTRLKQKHNAVIVAHPDDESLFFAGLIMQKRKRPWTVICATDGNADGNGTIRMDQFRQATKKMGVNKIHTLGLPDEYNKRLDVELIEALLKDLRDFDEVYTHNPIGEYGHPHHQDVSYAVHKCFNGKSNVYSSAYNCAPDYIVNLTKKNYDVKTKILSQIYFSETKRLIHFLPCTHSEGFTEFKFSEVRDIYEFFTYQKELETIRLKKFKWYEKYFSSQRERLKRRPF